MSIHHSYTKQQRQGATGLAAKIGVTAASRQLGIPKGTVNNWAYQARKKARQVEQEQRPLPQTNNNRPEKPEATTNKPSKKKVARAYTPSEKARALERAADIGVTATSEELGISCRCLTMSIRIELKTPNRLGWPMEDSRDKRLRQSI